jgi:hypothetical protein
MLVMAIKDGSYADGAHIKGCCRFIKVSHLYGYEERDTYLAKLHQH